MGLEVTELVMRAEEAFGITLADEDLADTYTVGDLYRRILLKLGNAEPERGEAWQASFAKVRALLAEELGIEEDRIQPEMRVGDIVPPQERRRLWPVLEAALGRSLPRLVRSKKEVCFTLAAWVLFVAGGCAALLDLDVWLGSTASTPLSFFLIFIGTPVYTYVAQGLTKNWAVHISDEAMDVRCLVDLACSARADALLPVGSDLPF